MDSPSSSHKPHAVCIPFPAQGHINPMLNLAKLLHNKGFHITFVNSEFNQQRLLKSQGLKSLNGLTSFTFETIPDGLPPPSNVNATQDIPSLCESTLTTCLAPFKELLGRLNDSVKVPKVSCIVSDGAMTFTLDAAEELGVPEVMLWTTSACGLYGYFQFPKLLEMGLIPLKDPGYISNGYLDTVLDWIPGMKNIRLKDLPSFLRTTDMNDITLNFILTSLQRIKRSSAIILNTFDELEHDILNELSSLFPPIYTIGPLHILHNQNNNLKSIQSNLWKEDTKCLEWLDTKNPNSVVYVNFGSITVMTNDQLTEFSWGLANSKQNFLWIIRPDLVSGDSAVLSPEFVEDIKERGLLTSWCAQEKVLSHRSVGGFLTHCGWNSMLESISSGVPMICWPFFAEQETNCWFCVNEWGVGMEINGDVKRDEVESLVREVMGGGVKGKEMKKKVSEWRKKAEEATILGGSSCLNLEKVIHQVLLPRQ